MSKPSHIFIGGSYRTGTSILRTALNQSADIAICDETHFFDDPRNNTCLRQYMRHSPALAPDDRLTEREAGLGFRRQIARIGSLADDVALEKIVEHLYQERPDLYWGWLQKNIEKAEFLRKLHETERTDRGLFGLLMELYADVVESNGSAIHGEKTPTNIHHVETLLTWFPNAKFVHAFRDPRGIFVARRYGSSTERIRRRRKPGTADAFKIGYGVITKWLRIVQLHELYQKQFPENYYLLRYEELMAEPATELESLCQFLTVAPTSKMVEALHDYAATAEQHQIYQDELSPLTMRWFRQLCQGALLKMGYVP